MSWGGAMLRGLGVAVIAYAVLARAPDYLVKELFGGLAPIARDVAVGGWEVAALVAVTWLLVRAQREERS